MSDILQLLEHFGYRFNGTGVYRRCIQNDSLVVNVEKDVFYWNSRNVGGNALTFLTKIEGYEFRHACKFMEHLTGIPYKKPHQYSNNSKPLTFPTNEQIAYLTRRTEFYQSNLNSDNIDYWYKSGMTQETIKQFKLGKAPECPTAYNVDSYTIPYIRNKNIINIKHRLNTTGGDKYRPELSGLNNYLFNSDGLKRQEGLLWPGDAILLEGEKKAIVYHQAGFRTASISGANAWKDQFFVDFKDARIDTVYVMLDPGMEKKSDELVYRFNRAGIKSKSVFLPRKPDDILIYGEATPKDIIACLR